MNNMIENGGVVMMKDPKNQSFIFDEEGDEIVRQQLLDSYYDGITEWTQNDYSNNDN